MSYKNCIENWRNIGSAATLVGKQKLLFIFVNDNDNKNDWTNELRNPVEEKVKQGLRWLETEAKRQNIQLNIEHKCIPLKPSIACTVSMQIDEKNYCAGRHHSTWQDEVITKLTGKATSVVKDWKNLFKTSGLPLSDTEGSAVFFCVRKHANSVAFPFFKEEKYIEFEKERGIIYDSWGQKGQIYLDSLIVHEILHLYGAKDLARNTPKCLLEYGKQYPDDVMHTSTQKPLKDYCISDLTAYLIGWKNIAPSLTDFTC